MITPSNTTKFSPSMNAMVGLSTELRFHKATLNGMRRFFPRSLIRLWVKVAEHSFKVPMPNSPLLLSHLCFGAHFLQESRLTTEIFILAF